MLSFFVYPLIFLIVWSLFGIFAAVILLRLIFNYSDPNPFGTVGRFGFKIRKLTERWVYPAARFFAMYRIDTRLAPLLTLFIGFVLTFFATQIIYDTFYVIDKLNEGIVTANPKMIFGIILYAVLGLLVLFIFVRFLASWFVFTRKTFLAFVMRVTDPIMRPVQKLIPPIGMFDISAMLVLLLIGFLQQIIVKSFIGN